MSRKDSGYERKERDHYPTPAWVIDALAEVVPLKSKRIWEPACGTGEMAEAIEAHGATVTASDIHAYGYRFTAGLFDFMEVGSCPWLVHYDGIITNPPYGARCGTAEQFIEAGLRRIQDYGFLALLLPVDFDSAKTRARFFRDCPAFAGRIVLTRRIKWFDQPTADGKSQGPSENHAWFLWQNTWIRDRVPPRVWYAPKILTEAAA